MNKYYSFKLHKYTNMQDNDLNKPALKKSRDVEIPMVPCQSNSEFDGGFDESATMFCPQYSDDDIMFGSYYNTKYAWLRLAVHRCNPNDTVTIDGVEQQKQCANRTEQDKYFNDHILSFLVNQQAPNLQDHENPVKKQNEDITYSVKTSTLTQWSELWIERSQI